MKVTSITINGIGGIKNLTIDFDDHMNFICGPNGIGKTTILECIAHAFTHQGTRILRRNVLSDSGELVASLEFDGKALIHKISINDFAPQKESHVSGLHQYSKYLLSLKVTRTFRYQLLNAVSMDVEKLDHIIWGEAISGVNVSEVKNWFVNRHLYSKHDGSLTSQQQHNLELAKKCFSLLSEDYIFSKVMASSNEIMVNTPSGEIYYEYLSSGFKSCLSILFGIIKDIEFRFKEPGINADDFDGIILVDELELHLHPEWQSKIAKILKKVFPKVQFITATHSPHIIQAANPKEIIALASEAGNVYRRDLSDGEYGFQGWTVEEVLTDVMGMTDTRTKTYHEILSKFENAIESSDFQMASEVYEELNKLLHPENHLRKLLKLELAFIKEAD